MKDLYDRIAASSPLNSTAGKVTSGGSHYEPSFKPSRLLWDAPPPMKPVPALAAATTAKGILGTKFGRMTVVGLLDDTRNHNAAWVVRCVCGSFETRKAKAIRSPTNTDDCCQRCTAVRRHQKNYRKLGGRAIEEFTNPEGLK